MWDQELLKNVIHEEKLRFNCSSIEVNEQVNWNKFHVCSTLSTCPIHKQNILHSLKRSKVWASSQYMCEWKKHLLNVSQSVNIIVLGGSVTAGQFTENYGCVAKFENKCKDVNQRQGKFSWGHYLKEWFEVQRKTNVKVHLFATHGYSSANMNEAIVEKLTNAGLKSLSSADLILVDHSYNDGLYLTKIKVMPLQRGLEGLIRKLYTHGRGSTPQLPSQRPRIILMETLAYLPHWLPFYQDYQKFYTTIASHYQIPIWSIRDAVNSEYSSTHQSEYVKVMRHDESVRYDLHPGWHMHLFYADMVAAMIQFTTSRSKCNSIYTHRQGQRATALPPPLLKDVNTTCDRSVAPILDISAEKVMNNLPVIGTWDRYPADASLKAWDLRSEGRGRVGWIQEKLSFPSGLKSYPARITFYPNDPQRSLGRDGQTPHVIQIQYLRTYANAGQVRVYVCGHLIQGGDGMVRGNLDGLWLSYDSYKLSLPEIEYIVFPDFGFHCKNESDMGIRFEYVENIACRDRSTMHSCSRELAARTEKQKFKIISIKVCQLGREFR